MANITEFRITSHDAGQRLDNFLLKRLTTTAKSHLYKMIRKGSIRCNKKRIKVTHKLQLGDVVSLPFLWQEDKKPDLSQLDITKKLLNSIIFENEDLLVLNKPAGIASQAGTGIPFGICDYLNHYASGLHLVHRLDRPTSGVLVLAKHVSACRQVQDAMSKSDCVKTYVAVVNGCWQESKVRFELKLEKLGGRVEVSPDGKLAVSDIYPIQSIRDFSYLRVKIKTGRMHQIRVTLSSLGYPILGDQLYGDRHSQNVMEGENLFLHAKSLVLYLGGKKFEFNAQLDEDKKQCLNRLFQRKD